jgi:uncharacterized protein
VNVAVTGSSGFIGSALCAALESEGHHVVHVVRSGEPAPERIGWDPEAGTIDARAFAGIDAIVNLAGRPIGNRRWTVREKSRILNSRAQGTALLSEALALQSKKPDVMISASAVGFYGTRADEVLSEGSHGGEGFLAEVCRAWEGATRLAEDAGIRVAHIRTGLVLDPAGGIMKRLLLPFRLGLGGRLGSGHQWMPWISMEDEVGAIMHLLADPGARGPFNLSAPEPVRNTTFTHELGEALHRPTPLPVPKAAIGAVFGRELTDDLLSSQRAIPARLHEAGYRFRSSTLASALRTMLDR